MFLILCLCSSRWKIQCSSTSFIDLYLCLRYCDSSLFCWFLCSSHWNVYSSVQLGQWSQDGSMAILHATRRTTQTSLLRHTLLLAGSCQGIVTIVCWHSGQSERQCRFSFQIKHVVVKQAKESDPRIVEEVSVELCKARDHFQSFACSNMHFGSSSSHYRVPPYDGFLSVANNSMAQGTYSQCRHVKPLAMQHVLDLSTRTNATDLWLVPHHVWYHVSYPTMVTYEVDSAICRQGLYWTSCWHATCFWFTLVIHQFKRLLVSLVIQQYKRIGDWSFYQW